MIGWGGNSGFQAANLVAHFAPRRIALVGFDMSIDQGVHWHGAHPAGLNNPDRGAVERWRRVFDAAAPDFGSLGIEVVNCSEASALRAYPKISLEQALGS